MEKKCCSFGCKLKPTYTIYNTYTDDNKEIPVCEMHYGVFLCH